MCKHLQIMCAKYFELRVTLFTESAESAPMPCTYAMRPYAVMRDVIIVLHRGDMIGDDSEFSRVTAYGRMA